MNLHKWDTPSTLTKKQDISRIWEPVSRSPVCLWLLTQTELASWTRHKYSHIGCPLLHLPPLSQCSVCKVNLSCWVWLWVMPSHWRGLAHCVNIPWCIYPLPRTDIWAVWSSELPRLTLLQTFLYLSFDEHTFRHGIVGGSDLLMFWFM